MRTSLQILTTFMAAHIAIIAQAQTLNATPIAPISAPATETTAMPSSVVAPSVAEAMTPVEATLAAPVAAPIVAETPVAPVAAAPSSKSVSHWLCGDKATPLLLTNDENKGLVQIENNSIEMKSVASEKGTNYKAVDGSDASFVIMDKAAVLVAANKDKTSCALVEQPAVTQ